MEPLRCFTDASYNPQEKIAVPGFKVEGEVPVRFEINGDLSGCAEAEERAIIICIDHCKTRYPGRNLLIHTDHEGSFKMLLPAHVKLVKMAGHLPKEAREKSEEQLLFSEVDRKVRSVLRKIVNMTP